MSYPANKSVAIRKGGREIPSRAAREHRADTIPNEMRHVDQSESRSCAVIERDDGRRKIIIHILNRVALCVAGYHETSDTHNHGRQRPQVCINYAV